MSSLYSTQAQFFRGKTCYITIKRPANRVRPQMDDSTTPRPKHLKGYFLQIELNLDLQMRRKRSHNAVVSIHYQI